MEADAPTLRLARLFPDALEDSYVAAYCLLVVSPVCWLAARWLLRRGKSATPAQVLLVSLLVPLVLVGLPAALYWFLGEKNVYQLLQMSRVESRYVWAQKYAFWRNLYQTGQMPAHIWQHIDKAYDSVYNDKARFLYDYWGPAQVEMSLVETQCNTALFYILWTTIIYALTMPKAAEAGSKWAFSGLVMMLVFELSVKVLRYDPPIKALFRYTTPREFVMWGHRLLPILVFASVTVKRVFFVDLEAHHRKVLEHLSEKNKQTLQELQEVEKALFPDEEDENEEEEVAGR